MIWPFAMAMTIGAGWWIWLLYWNCRCEKWPDVMFDFALIILIMNSTISVWQHDSFF